MIKPDMIPDEVINAYMHMIVYGGVDGSEALAAALNAWPGAAVCHYTIQNTEGWELVLPLPQGAAAPLEARDE